MMHWTLISNAFSVATSILFSASLAFLLAESTNFCVVTCSSVFPFFAEINSS